MYPALQMTGHVTMWLFLYLFSKVQGFPSDVKLELKPGWLKHIYGSTLQIESPD